MTERYINATDTEYSYCLDTESEDYKTLEDFEKKEFEDYEKEGYEEKPTRKEIIEQMMNQEPIISDEEAFLRHLIKRWGE